MAETLIFEPHSLFRHEPIDGEEFPFGYISKGPGQPIFALHESFGDVPVEELARIARLMTTAPELLTAVIQYRDDLRHPIDEDSRHRRLAMVEALISKATSRQPEGEQ